MNSFSFISFSSPFLAQMCGHNLCNLQSALPRCAPQVLSISAGRGRARLAFFGEGGAARFSAGRVGMGQAFLLCTLHMTKKYPIRNGTTKMKEEYILAKKYFRSTFSSQDSTRPRLGPDLAPPLQLLPSPHWLLRWPAFPVLLEATATAT